MSRLASGAHAALELTILATMLTSKTKLAGLKSYFQSLLLQAMAKNPRADGAEEPPKWVMNSRDHIRSSATTLGCGSKEAENKASICGTFVGRAALPIQMDNERVY